MNENISLPESIEQIETSDIQNMEVHHHPHVEKKSFKEYLHGQLNFLRKNTTLNKMSFVKNKASNFYRLYIK